MRLSLFHVRHFFLLLPKLKSAYTFFCGRGRCTPHTHSRRRTSPRTLNLEEPSTFCESWHRGGHGGVLGSSRFGLLLIFDFGDFRTSFQQELLEWHTGWGLRASRWIASRSSPRRRSRRCAASPPAAGSLSPDPATAAAASFMVFGEGGTTTFWFYLFV